MMSDASHLEDIDIVKLDESPRSVEEEVYRTADKEVSPSKLSSTQPSASENEVLKEKEEVDRVPIHLKPLKPYVSERIDQPGKRIFLNLTIATDEGSDSVYTLHVEVPTGGGSHNIKEVLTHEHRAEQAESYAESCVPEPPPRMPDCPCSCLPPPATTYLDDGVDIDSGASTMATTATATSTPLEGATILSEDGVRDGDNGEPEPVSRTATNPPEIDNHIAASNTEPPDAAVVEALACPDVMPVLILEGELCTVPLLLTRFV